MVFPRSTTAQIEFSEKPQIAFRSLSVPDDWSNHVFPASVVWYIIPPVPIAQPSFELANQTSQTFALDSSGMVGYGHLPNGDAYLALPVRANDGNKELWVAVQNQVPNGFDATGRRYGPELDEGVSRLIALHETGF